MTIFLFSLAGVPPFGGWFAKLQVFKTPLEPDDRVGRGAGAIGAVNTAIAAAYYMRVLREMWMNSRPTGTSHR